MTQATDNDIRDLRDLIGRLDTKIDKLDNKIDIVSATIQGDIKELRGEIKAVDSKIDIVSATIQGDIKALDAKFDERTKGIGQRLDGKELVQRNLSIGTTVVVVGGLLLAFAKYLFFGSAPF